MAARRASRRNSGFSITYNGRRANAFYDLAERVGQSVSRFGEAERKAKSGLRRRMEPVAAREIRKLINVRRGTLSGTMRVETKTHREGDALSLWASARRISLLEFGGRWGGRKTEGATAEVLRGQRTLLRSRFIVSVKGLRAIRKRQFNRGTGKPYPRGPLKMEWGPSPLYMLRPTDTPDRLTNAARTIKRAVVTQLTDFYINELRRLYKLDIGGKR